MNARRVVLIAFIGAIMAGCSESTTGSNVSPEEVAVSLASPLWAFVPVGGDLGNLPAMRVHRALDGRAIVGRPVVFTIQRPDGASEQLTVLTDGTGLARLPSWDSGRGPGHYTVTAVTDGWGPILFKVSVRGEVVAIYDLKTLDGNALPVSGYPMTEAHYVLYEGGLYNQFYERGVEPFTAEQGVVGMYVRPDNLAIHFSLLALTPWAPGGQLGFWQGLLTSDGGMTIVRGHYLDFPVEGYVLRR